MADLAQLRKSERVAEGNLRVQNRRRIPEVHETDRTTDRPSIPTNGRTMKRPTILNRDFKHPEDAWYQIEPKGAHPNRAAKIIQVIDDEAIQQIVNRFNADADAGKLSHGHEMLIDHEHFKLDASKETVAYGWLTK